jgi:proteasome lid subunit RPN8/RPN11
LNAHDHQIVKIDPDRLRELIADVEHTSEERCGFLIGYHAGARIVTTVLPAKNVAAADRHVRFAVDPLEYLRAEKYAASNRLELLGVYHSHPNSTAVPSETDRQQAHPHFSYVILSVIDQQFAGIRSWRLNQDRHFEEEVILH